MQVHPFIDQLHCHGHQNRCCQQQVQNECSHLLPQDRPAVRYSDCSLLECGLYSRYCHASCQIGTRHTKHPAARLLPHQPLAEYFLPAGRGQHIHQLPVSLAPS